MTRFFLALFLAAQPVAAAAQSLSADDIRAMVDQRVASLDPYRALLEDPDETRAMAAMDIMMESGDADLRRMALEYGLYSPSPIVQRMALDAFFSSMPVLNVRSTMAAGGNESDFHGLHRDYNGSVSSDGTGFFPLAVGARDETNRCFVDQRSRCLVRISETGVSISLWGDWWQLVIDGQGNLIGSGSERSVRMNVSIPINF